VISKAPINAFSATLGTRTNRTRHSLLGHEALQNEAGKVAARLEGLVSKLRDRPYRGGRSKHWIKVENRTHEPFDRVQKAHQRDETIYP
jgi:ATP-dependent DNA ligase